MIKQYSLQRGAAGTRETLQMMRLMAREGAADPRVQAVATRVDPLLLDSIMRSVWDFKNEHDETLIGAGHQVEQFMATKRLAGDCDDAAILAGAIGMARGLGVVFVAARPPNNPNFGHVFAELIGPEFHIMVDPTAPTDADYNGWEFMEEKVDG